MKDDSFRFISQNGSDMFSKMSMKDLTKLKDELINYEIMYRFHIGIMPGNTFGIEIEYMNGFINNFPERNDISNDIYCLIKEGIWEVEEDGSLGNNGSEIISPILVDKSICWNDIKNVCNYIRPLAKITDKCGGHIHVGAQALTTPTSWLNFLRLWAAYENTIFKFLYGEYENGRKGISLYAMPIKDKLMELYFIAKDARNFNRFMYDSFDDLFKTRYSAINFRNVGALFTSAKGNTIEFRSPNGSLDEIVWQNNIVFIFRLLEYANSLDFNNDIIEKRFSNMSKNISYENNGYDKLYIKQGVELCDLIFNNNLEKLNFLKQYFKSYDNNKVKKRI